MSSGAEMWLITPGNALRPRIKREFLIAFYAPALMQGSLPTIFTGSQIFSTGFICCTKDLIWLHMMTNNQIARQRIQNKIIFSGSREVISDFRVSEGFIISERVLYRV